MDNETKLKQLIAEAAKAIGIDIKPEEVVIDHSKDASHGDYSTNIAMRYAKVLHKAPRDIASEFSAELTKLDDSLIEKIEIAGPGFINIKLKFM